jgi:hypothetical protein
MMSPCLSECTAMQQESVEQPIGALGQAGSHDAGDGARYKARKPEKSHQIDTPASTEQSNIS